MEPTIGVLYVHAEGVAGRLLERLQTADVRLSVHRSRAETEAGGLAVDCVLLDAPHGTVVDVAVEQARAAYGPVPVIVRTEPGVTLGSDTAATVIETATDGDLDPLIAALVTAGAGGLVPEGVTLRDDVLDSVPIGVTIADLTRPDNPLIYVNEHFEELTGYPETEILGRNCRFLQGPDTATAPVRKMREAIDGGEASIVTLLNYRKDGSPFWNRVELIPVREADGRIGHYLGFQRDVTADECRKTAEARVREARRELLALQTQTPEPTDRLERALELGRRALDVPTATVLELDGDGEPSVLLEEGTELGAAGIDVAALASLAQRAVDEGDVWGFGRREQRPDGTESVGCFLGTAIPGGDDQRLAVCFLDRAPRRAGFCEAEVTFVATLGAVAGRILSGASMSETPI